MKIRIFSILLLTLLLMGCSKEKIMTCTLNITNNLENYQNISEYKIYYNGNYVTKINKEEKYISTNENVLDYFKEYKELEYYNLSDMYEGVKYSVKKTDSYVIINSNIDLKEFNIDGMSKDGKIDKDYVILGKLKLSGIKKIYEERGATCE